MSPKLFFDANIADTHPNFGDAKYNNIKNADKNSKTIKNANGNTKSIKIRTAT